MPLGSFIRAAHEFAPAGEYDLIKPLVLSVQHDRRLDEAKEESFCSSHSDCSSCNKWFPTCAWCGNTGRCHVAPPELRDKAPYIHQMHVLYNLQEYQKTYGKGQMLRQYESVTGDECRVWIVNSTSCHWVGQYCNHAGSCRSCLQRSGGGCGWCHGQSRCMPGTQSSELRMSTDEATCNSSATPPGTWVFGNWAKYMDHGIWENTCAKIPDMLPSAQNSWSSFGEGTSGSRSNSRGTEEPATGNVAAQMIPITITLAAIFSMMVITFFFIMKFRRVAFLHGPARHEPRRHPSQDFTANGTGVDIQALETRLPSCRPVIIGASHHHRSRHRADEETGSEISSDSVIPCAVCLSHMEIGDEARSLPCEHLFHKQCIDSWLARSLQCPVCRSVVGAAASVDPLPCAYASNGAAASLQPGGQPGPSMPSVSVESIYGASAAGPSTSQASNQDHVATVAEAEASRETT